MIRTTTLFSRTVAIATSLLMVNMAVPMTLGKWVGDAVPDLFKASPKKKPFATRMLTPKEMNTVQGKYVRNPYVAGANKWSVSYKGVDLLTGNFSTSGTDMTFEGGYGIPINVTRSYSANDQDEGPLGEGWTLSVDVRSTAGGILKSPAAPVRSVPNNFRERPSVQLCDPNAARADGSAEQPAEAVLATDSSGKDETVEKDVDGVLTTPPWDKNNCNPVYETVTLSGSKYQVLVSNDVLTPDGTTYHYEKMGYYDGGAVSITGEGDPEPSNILKVTTVTDRQGNVTTYHYSNYDLTHSWSSTTYAYAQFAKSNGATREQKLTSIEMPNGHVINFTWAHSSSTGNYDRIVSVDDNVSGGRTVTYGYDSSGRLTGVTTPAGLTTTYGYGDGTSAQYSDYSWPSTGILKVLTSITDPRGMVTTIGYTTEESKIAPYMVSMQAVRAWKVVMPNGVTTYYRNGATCVPAASYYASMEPTGFQGEYVDIAYGQSTPFQGGNYVAYAHETEPIFETGMDGIGGEGGSDSIVITAGESTWVKYYDSRTQDLLTTTRYISPMVSTFLNDRFMTADQPWTKMTITRAYNFMGNPLTETTREATRSGSSYSTTRLQTIDYAYWGQGKYFQEKATRAQLGASTYRYNYTDYFDSTAAAGAKGQVKASFTPSFTTFTEDSSTIPAGTSTSDYWKYRLVPSDASTAAVKFYDSSGNPSYDSKGRCTDVWRLQSTSTTPWTYVQTHTVYGGDGSPHWGQPYQVVEDYGTGHINRTTTTNAYTTWGAANDVTDALGHRFYTDTDSDGKMLSVTRTDVTPHIELATYSYGSTGISKGQVTQVTDEVSGVTQSVSYNDGSSTAIGNLNYIGGIGEVKNASEDDSSTTSYGTSYTYDAVGDRSTAVFTKNSSETGRWGYADYVSTGEPSQPSRVFQTLVKLDTSNNPTSEEIHYSYDGSGRLLEACFAQTPASGFTPSTGASYFDSSHRASTRARAYYLYDAGGRMTQLNYWWDTWSGSGYGAPEAIISNTCAYEVSTGTSNYNRGLKTTSNFYFRNSSDHSTFSLDHQELYGYDNNRDYLTSASYDGGSTSTTWSYDAAGNRNDATVVDNLNRATTISSVSRAYDILGNTTSVGSTKWMTWDDLNRLSSFVDGSNTTNYAYRADGSRVRKTSGTQTVTFGYDAQMPVEECLTDSGTSSNDYTIRYALGARGIDRIETTTTSTLVTYPIYDSHGNMISTLSKSGGGYSYSSCRFFDVWGAVRSGATTGTPTARYCANLGHVHDDESSLIYMRARYYEPASGRFVREDPGMHGWNWFTYCGNNPVNAADASGKDEFFDYAKNVVGKLLFWIGGASLGAAISFVILGWNDPEPAGRTACWEAAKICTKTAFFYFLVAQGCTDGPLPWGFAMLVAFSDKYKLFEKGIELVLRGMQLGSDTMACIAVIACGAYALWVYAELMGQ